MKLNITKDSADIKTIVGDFPGGPSLRLWASAASGVGSIPGQELRFQMLCCVAPSKKIIRKCYSLYI